MRGDTDFSLTVNFDRWSAEADFIFGYDAQPAIVKRAEALEDDDWERVERRPRYTSRTGRTRSKRADVKGRIVRERGYLNKRLNFEHVAEYDYSPPKCRTTYRMVVVRKNISKMKGELTLVDELRYFFYITTRRDLSAAEVVRLANARCDQENVVAQLKGGVGAMRVPLYDLLSNWAYMVMAALAWNLKSWFAMMMHLKTDRRSTSPWSSGRSSAGSSCCPARSSAGPGAPRYGSSAGSPRSTGCSAPGTRSSGPPSGNAASSPPSCRERSTASGTGVPRHQNTPPNERPGDRKQASASPHSSLQPLPKRQPGCKSHAAQPKPASGTVLAHFGTRSSHEVRVLRDATS